MAARGLPWSERVGEYSHLPTASLFEHGGTLCAILRVTISSTDRGTVVAPSLEILAAHISNRPNGTISPAPARAPEVKTSSILHESLQPGRRFMYIIVNAAFRFASGIARGSTSLPLLTLCAPSHAGTLPNESHARLLEYLCYGRTHSRLTNRQNAGRQLQASFSPGQIVVPLYHPYRPCSWAGQREPCVRSNYARW